VIAVAAAAPKQKTDAEHLLEILQAWGGEWVPHLYRVSGVMVHSRIADLRRRGHTIECQRFGQGDYRYRLIIVPAPGAEQETT
jgi:hypothetical protein